MQPTTLHESARPTWIVIKSRLKAARFAETIADAIQLLDVRVYRLYRAMQESCIPCIRC
jgi:hypothetical protein